MRHYYILVISLFMVLHAVKAQSLQELVDNFSLGLQSNSTIINDAVTPALSIVRQQFRLERNGKFYGKNNLPYYGETYSLGVKISGGELLQNQVVFPWESDSDYKRVNQASNYKPVYFWSYQRALSDSAFSATELELGTEYVRLLSKDSLLFMHTDEKSDFGLIVDDIPGEKSGYIIWAYTNNITDSAMQVSLKQYPLKIVACQDSLVSVKPKDPDNILGGIYVIPTIERTGVIRIKLAGVCSRIKTKEWVICLLTKEDNREINKKKKSSSKSQKESLDGAEPTPIK